MSHPPTAGGAGARAADVAAETAEMLELLDASIAQTRAAGRPDLADKLVKSRRQLTSGAWHVLVAGEFKRGKSALVNALLGVPVCGVDPVAYTAVPTLVHHGDRPSAALVEDTEDERTRHVDIRTAADHSLRGVADDGTKLRAVDVTLPRELLADGLVLVDTPGLGGGFAAAAAAATMRALALADGVIVVTDASQELTSAEIEFVRHAVTVCPNLICVLTKTDLYPEWRRVLELDRGHLRASGIEAEFVAVSAPLRELALDTGDPALNAESGFPVLVDRLRSRLLADHAGQARIAAAATVRGSLRQIADTLTTEHTALTRPDERPATMRKVQVTEQRAQGLSGPSSRWLNTINDRFADIQARLDIDLAELVRRLETDVGRRIREGDPTTEWAEIVPWLQRRTNQELTDAHRRLIGMINDVAGEISSVFDATADQIDALAGRTDAAVGGDLTLSRLGGRATGKLEVGMHAARGWSLSSSVVTTLLVSTLHPGFLIALPITAVLGTVFAVKAVRSYQTNKLDATRNEALRAVTVYLNQARADAGRASLDLLRHSRGRIRDYFLDRAAELVSAARHEQAAATQAVRTDGPAAVTRATEAKAELDRVGALLAAADRLAGIDRSSASGRLARTGA
jgi:hypothetical protein